VIVQVCRIYAHTAILACIYVYTVYAHTRFAAKICNITDRWPTAVLFDRRTHTDGRRTVGTTDKFLQCYCAVRICAYIYILYVHTYIIHTGALNSAHAYHTSARTPAKSTLHTHTRVRTYVHTHSHLYAHTYTHTPPPPIVAAAGTGPTRAEELPTRARTGRHNQPGTSRPANRRSPCVALHASALA
jgi:hypothetical protein